MKRTVVSCLARAFARLLSIGWVAELRRLNFLIDCGACSFCYIERCFVSFAIFMALNCRAVRRSAVVLFSSISMGLSCMGARYRG